MSKSLNAVASARVEPDQLRRVIDAAEEQRDDPDPAPAEIIIAREFAGSGLPATVVMAIMFRMEALAGAIKDKSTAKWTIDVEGKGYSLVPEAIIEAAAVAPLILHEGRGRHAEFDIAELLRLALLATKSAGRT